MTGAPTHVELTSRVWSRRGCWRWLRAPFATHATIILRMIKVCATGRGYLQNAAAAPARAGIAVHAARPARGGTTGIEQTRIVPIRKLLHAARRVLRAAIIGPTRRVRAGPIRRRASLRPPPARSCAEQQDIPHRTSRLPMGLPYRITVSVGSGPTQPRPTATLRHAAAHRGFVSLPGRALY